MFNYLVTNISIHDVLIGITRVIIIIVETNNLPGNSKTVILKLQIKKNMWIFKSITPVKYCCNKSLLNYNIFFKFNQHLWFQILWKGIFDYYYHNRAPHPTTPHRQEKLNIPFDATNTLIVKRHFWLLLSHKSNRPGTGTAPHHQV